MVKNKKKVLLLAIILALLALFAVGTTLAYLTDVKSVLNILGIGHLGGNPYVQIELDEPEYNRLLNGQPFLADVLPGDTIIKDPTVMNVGSVGVYARITVYKTDMMEPGSEISEMELLEQYGAKVNSEWFYHDPTRSFYYVGNSLEMAELKSGEISQLFALNNDGVAKEFTTEHGDYTITIDPKSTNHNVGDIYFMNIKAEAIQARNFVPDSFSSNDPWIGSGDIIENI